ncbi:MAG: YihA family ribosome biogenesis GTP-binding protein [Nitrospirae bacterium]|nr:YihA family ribosome biogenesis GTP-binding protein [Nitrospirota bacterium]
MRINSVEFVTSADRMTGCPPATLPEIAFAGRSNVGKSSIINSLLKRKDTAKVSSTPGKTRLINFFRVNNSFHLVDLPGYGHARVSAAEKKRWGVFIEDYLTKRETLRVVVLLRDISIPPVASDTDMADWMIASGIPFIEVLTKADKAGQGEIARRVNAARETIPADGAVLVVSSKTGLGIDKLWKEMSGRLLASDTVNHSEIVHRG